MRKPTKGIIGMNIALPISYNASTRFTYALLIGLSNAQQNFTYEQVMDLGK
jgi:hypothetical protein